MVTARQEEMAEDFKVLGTQTAVAEKHGVHRATVCRALKAVRGVTSSPRKRAPKKGRSLEDFEKNHDPALSASQSVERAVKKLLEGPEGEPLYCKDDQVRVVAGISKARWKTLRKQFSQLQVTTKEGQKMWGHESIIDRMRLIVNR